MAEEGSPNLIQHLNKSDTMNKLLIIVLIFSVVLGILTGYLLSHSKNNKLVSSISRGATEAPKNPEQDIDTFNNWADGTLQKKTPPKDPNEYVEGTHYLIREEGVPVALTSSVLDLTKYEGKKVRVYGKTEKPIKEGWLMDVGRVEEK